MLSVLMGPFTEPVRAVLRINCGEMGETEIYLNSQPYQFCVLNVLVCVVKEIC